MTKKVEAYRSQLRSLEGEAVRAFFPGQLGYHGRLFIESICVS